MSDEIEDDVAEFELKDYALELKMKKLESEATRLLHHSNELLQAINKEAPKKEEMKQEDSEVKDPEESKIPS
ncbi:MAG: hypothetical protein CVU54_12105 [Deltaproteobacteria bacterium HGW-Deltaproteobacteria-12]|jgi:uncharacterized protein YoxC|nr:MAG: hypothetical protein CVU54_12105 [Deltaproteobacteria bacterium HGW-Deltaproteobacteria-12]